MFPGDDIEIVIDRASAGMYAMYAVYEADSENEPAPVTLQSFLTLSDGTEQQLQNYSFSLAKVGNVRTAKAIIIHAGRKTGGYQVRGHKLEAHEPLIGKGIIPYKHSL